jgi:hypothetical protein
LRWLAWKRLSGGETAGRALPSVNTLDRCARVPESSGCELARVLRIDAYSPRSIASNWAFRNASYRELLKRYKPKNIGIYGCSAGGALTAETAA